ncbi:hypothetical protein SAMN05444372_105243 [Flavobacterium micromati]|uniref:Uncharacterized protein n=1 Tax=Flavobacterium micromati TaxID=229205 RepID=A0A1M5JLN1_9FLAO|nr:hypothetical protein [Flavobacterium micromati]SHG41170.1 hypothetical protein SAMN05444372_105243 [Flavobacterium micromati]
MKQDVHAVLNAILKANIGYMNQYTLLEIYPQVGMNDPYLKCLNRLFTVINLGIKKSEKDTVHCVVREYKNSQILLLLPYIYLFKNKLLFLINHNLAHDPKLKLHHFLDTIGIQFLTVDGNFSVNDEKLFRNKINVDSEIISKIINFKEKEVVIFSKNYKEILQNNSFSGYKILIPDRNSSINMEIGNNLIKYGTQSQDAFLRMLELAEIVIIDYDKKEYFYRTSGLIWDCIRQNNYIITNKYLVFEYQLRNYDKKKFFDSINELQFFENLTDL